MTVASLDQSLRLPVIASPMFLVSGVKLVVECCKQQIVGSFPSVNRRTTEAFEEMLVTIKEELAACDQPIAPYGVNLVIHKTNPRWRADLEICVKHEVPIIITSLGAAQEVVDAVHSYGGLVFHDVANAYHARKAAQAGVDGIIAVANGAGGHSGTINPLALIGEIRKFFDGTLILGGSITSGRDVAAALQMGASYAYMGTRFINVQESEAPERYKDMISDSSSSDILLTPAITGVNCNFLKPSLIELGYDLDKLTDPTVINYGEKLKPPKEGAKTWVDTWSAGHGTGVIDDVPTVEELVNRLDIEFREAATEQFNRVNLFMRK